VSTEAFVIRPGHPLKGDVRVPGDKSISHRSILLGMLADGETHVRGWLAAGDTEATLGVARALGVQVDRLDTHTLVVHGGALQPPDQPLDFVNAGTGIRLFAGIMAGQSFPAILDGSYQLRRRPMKRITMPLREMGANIEAENERVPLQFKPAQLKGIDYTLPMASAQVKSAVLLAGLFAEGPTTVIEPGPARDHTERMLSAMGAHIVTEDNRITITPGTSLKPMNLTVPGDFSSAAFLLVAASIVPESDITIKGVNLNTTRTGLLDVMLDMGADITVIETGTEAGELVGDIQVKYSAIKGVNVGGDTVVRMIDEFPVFMIAALYAEGRTIVRDAKELRVKETDRLAVMTGELQKLGAVIIENEDGFIIDGPQQLLGAVVDGHDDHRIAMSLTIAGLFADEQTVVTDSKCAGDSFPGFKETVAMLGGQLIVDDSATFTI